MERNRKAEKRINIQYHCSWSHFLVFRVYKVAQMQFVLVTGPVKRSWGGVSQEASTHRTTQVLHNTTAHCTTVVVTTQYKYTSYYTSTTKYKYTCLYTFYFTRRAVVGTILDTGAKEREQQPAFDFDQYLSKPCLAYMCTTQYKYTSYYRLYTWLCTHSTKQGGQ